MMGNIQKHLLKQINANPDDFDIKGNKYLILAEISNLLNKTDDSGKYYDSALVALNFELSQRYIMP